jgi:cell division protease FtsH
MVTEWGMSERLGRLRYNANDEEVFLGHSVTRSQHLSEDTARLIDEEVRTIVEHAEAEARRVLAENIDALHRVAQALLEYETLSGEDTRRILRGEAVERGGDAGRAEPPAHKASVPTGGRSEPKPDAGPIGGPAPQPQG